MQLPKRILIVEDSPTCAVALKRLVESLGYSADVVADGERALVQASCNFYAMILMDLRLPGKDGFATATAIRSHDRMVPIVSITAYPLKDDPARAAESAIDDFVCKGYRRDELERVISMWANARDNEFHVSRAKQLATAS